MTDNNETNEESINMNNGQANDGSTCGASSDGDLDFQGQADHTEASEQAETKDHKCGCGKSDPSQAETKDHKCGCGKSDPSNDFPKSQEPSGDGTGIKAGGEQAE